MAAGGRPWEAMPTFPFSPFDKIAERPAQWGADEGALRRLARLPWVVTEKIHGANFCVAIDEHGVHAAKRKRWLDPQEDFFGHRRLLTRLQGPLLALASEARQGREQGTAILIYGELFGGAYPHPQVTPVPGVEPVQTGVWYTPEVALSVFDVALVIAGKKHPEFLDFDRTLALARASGLLASEPLLVGSYRDALDFPERFSSTLPARLGLPPLPQANLAEGVVLRPRSAVVLEGPKGPVRPLLKKKIAEFAEDERYAGARPWAPPAATGEPLLDRIEREALLLVTPARLAAARSKVGPSRDEAGRRLVVEEALADLWEELSARLPAELNQLDPEERTLLQELLRQRLSLPPSFDGP